MGDPISNPTTDIFFFVCIFFLFTRDQFILFAVLIPQCRSWYLMSRHKFVWHAHRLRSLVTDVTPTGMHAYDGHSNTLWLCHEQGCLYWNLHCVLHVDSHQRASFLHTTLATIINGLICVGLVYPSSYPVDSV